MADIHNPQLDKVYSAQTVEQAEVAYDDWAEKYEADVFAFGFRLPAAAATIWARFVALDSGPILDAGCGTGLQSESLALAGYQPITGVDLSEGMLSVAAKKGIYSELRQMTLGKRLDFADAAFANTYSVGAITPGHAPANSFDELIRVTRVGGLIVFSLRVDEAQEPAYPAAVQALAAARRWRHEFETDDFATMPIGEPDVRSRVYVYRVL